MKAIHNQGAGGVGELLAVNYTKDTKMKAIHNAIEDKPCRMGAVNYTQRYQKMKAIHNEPTGHHPVGVL